MDGPEHFFHGTKVALCEGDRIVPGHRSNYGAGRPAGWVYMTARLEIAVLAAELAAEGGEARVYVVAPEAAFEDDPNVTDKKFPGNPTRSYRTKAPLRVLGEVTGWARTPTERLAALRAFSARTRAEGIEPIE
ncbi:NAD(+)--rifampin ADP-ribosyltransferase [Tabrizicola sp.]|uniref:NAD(+)--rifampin ADP-ribosyltransferase n=1 Tax=Tabrizicola sp. TaxID=2005166 RepID=UPI002734D98E|nr:NAD(+)--rifampin ADP-ribosyltransferase [Tabrizicola sp.]MDP3195119.1 NAD(+)--rifampin ADP-ribosyltransferase [Tabrizicola sp.]